MRHRNAISTATCLIAIAVCATTWSEPRDLHLDATGKPAAMATGLTYLGNGELLATSGQTRWHSDDYGATWTSVANPPASNGRTWYEWDPLLVDKDPATGQVTRLMSFCSDNFQPDGHTQGYVRFSTDEGRTWQDEIEVPENGIDSTSRLADLLCSRQYATSPPFALSGVIGPAGPRSRQAQLCGVPAGYRRKWYG